MTAPLAKLEFIKLERFQAPAGHLLLNILDIPFGRPVVRNLIVMLVSGQFGFPFFDTNFVSMAFNKILEVSLEKAGTVSTVQIF